MRLPRRRDSQQPDPQPALPDPPTPDTASPAGTPFQTPPTGLAVHESVRIVTTPMPYDVAADHEGIPVIAAAHAPLADIDHDSCYLLTVVLEQLGRAASESMCDGLYGVHHTLAIDNGTMYITAMGTGARPTTNLDSPPGA